MSALSAVCRVLFIFECLACTQQCVRHGGIELTEFGSYLQECNIISKAIKQRQ